MTTITATPNPSTASVLLEITGAPSTATNLVKNPSIETNTTDWSTSGSGTAITRNTSYSVDGAASLRVTTGTGSSSGAYAAVTGITPGSTYGARLAVRTGNVSDLRITVQWLSAADALLGSVESTVTGAANGVWHVLSVTGTAPASTAKARVYIQRVNDSTSGLYFYIDNALLRELAGGETFDPDDYFDGDSLNCSWSGTAHASTSIRANAPVTISRNDANGLALVRLYDGQVPIAGSLTVTDSEAALTGTLTYEVTDFLGGTDSDTATLDVAAPRLVLPVLPIYKHELISVTEYDHRREFGGTVHQIISRQDPVPVMRKSRYRSGRMQVFVLNFAEGLAVERVLARGEVALLRQPTFPGMDFYFVPMATSLRPDPADTSERRWLVDVDFQQVAAPSGPLLAAAGWSFEDVATNYSTFATVLQSFGTFNDLTVGP